MRKYKGLGLALIAVLAMSAFAASGAQAAAHFGIGANTNRLDIQQDNVINQGGSFLQKITAGSLSWTCDTVPMSANVTPGTTPSSITSTNITYTDSTKEPDHCRGPLSTSPLINMGNCDYTFNVKETVSGSANNVEGDVTLGPEGCAITMSASLCTIHFNGAQTEGTVTYKNVAGNANQITIEPKVTNVSYHHEGLCGNGFGNDGTYEGNLLVQGTTANGAAGAISVT